MAFTFVSGLIAQLGWNRVKGVLFGVPMLFAFAFGVGLLFLLLCHFAKLWFLCGKNAGKRGKSDERV